jgi:hypothetical protein
MSQLDFDTHNAFNLDEIYSVSGFLSLCHSTIENNIPTCCFNKANIAPVPPSLGGQE